MNDKKLLDFLHFLLESNFATLMQVECEKAGDDEADIYSIEIKPPNGKTIFGVHLPVSGKQEKELKTKALLQIIGLVGDHVLNNKL